MRHQDSNGSCALTEPQIAPFSAPLTEANRDSEADRIEIKQLYDSILYNARISLEEAIRIGEILVKRKAKCEHGEFESWLEANVEFSSRTARRYMDLFLYRELLKSDNVSDLTTAEKVIKRAKLSDRLVKAGNKGLGRRGSHKSAEADPETDTSAQTREPKLRTRVINALSSKPLNIPKGESSKFVDLAQGNTEEEIIKSALRLREQSKHPGQVPPKPTEKSETIPLEVCPEPSKPLPMTGADVFVPESSLQYREHLEKGIVNEKVGKVPIKSNPEVSQKVRLKVLIGLLDEQFLVTLDCVKQLKIKCNASYQTKDSLEHLIHLAHLMWEPLNWIRNHVHIYVAPDEPKGEDPDYMI